MHSNKKFKIIFLLAGLVMLISATLPSPPKFKNLRILPKNISEEELDKVMDHFNMSLGVKCNFCHAKNTKADGLDFPSDNKPEKEIARKMMTMTTAINNKYFNFGKKPTDIQAITCYTCHRGSPRIENDSIPSEPGKE